MSTTLPKLAPAKPYMGEPQWQAVGAAARAFTKAGLARDKRSFSAQAEIKVSGRGNKRIRVRGLGEITASVAHVEFSIRRSHREDVDGPQIAKDVADKFVTALRGAGWTVEHTIDRFDYPQVLVYGHGLEAWAKQAAVERAADNQRKADQETAEQSAAAKFQALIIPAGLNVYVTRKHGTASATFSLEDLQQLISYYTQKAS